jgi:hypothetical protein
MVADNLAASANSAALTGTFMTVTFKGAGSTTTKDARVFVPEMYIEDMFANMHNGRYLITVVYYIPRLKLHSKCKLTFVF